MRLSTALGQLVIVLAFAIVASACGGQDAAPRVDEGEPLETADTLPPTTGTSAVPSTDPSTPPDDVAPSLWPTDPALLDPDTPVRWTVEIVETFDHDPTAFTQGLELLGDGTVLESTGLRGFSTIRIVELQSGTVTASVDLDPVEFGEGATRVGDIVIQLTWQEEVARRWQLPDLTPLDPFTYRGEGWGICFDGERLAMSDGSAELEWREPSTFEVLETVPVTHRGVPVTGLNELECVDDVVIANVWLTSALAVIGSDGGVVALVDAGELVERTPVEMSGDVLNGVADLGDGTLLLGGKRWPTIYRVRLIDA